MIKEGLTKTPLNSTRYKMAQAQGRRWAGRVGASAKQFPLSLGIKIDLIRARTLEGLVVAQSGD
jgi:hypothetical protein